MTDILNFALRAVAVGVGATLVMDAWAQLLLRFLGIASLNWAMVGRWVGHCTRGQFVHANIGKAAPIPSERLIGWLAHYATGIAFAAALLQLYGADWARHPTPIPAIAFGVCTVLFPFLIMQPGLGAGIAARKTPNPRQARLRSLMTHTVFGIGLYLAARSTTWLAVI